MTGVYGSKHFREFDMPQPENDRANRRLRDHRHNFGDDKHAGKPGVYSSKHFREFDMPQPENDRANKRLRDHRHNFGDDKHAGKRCGSFYEPDPKYPRCGSDFSKPITEINSSQYSKPSEIGEKITNVVLGAQFLNACQFGNIDDALKALDKITSYESLSVKDNAKKTIVNYGTDESLNAAPEIQHAIKCKIKYLYGEGLTKKNSTCDDIERDTNLTMDEIYVLDTPKFLESNPNFSSLVSTTNNGEHFKAPEVGEKILDTVFGAQLLTACQVGNIDAAREALDKITSYEGLKVKDHVQKTVVHYGTDESINIAPEIKHAIKCKIKSLYTEALTKNDSTCDDIESDTNLTMDEIYALNKS